MVCSATFTFNYHIIPPYMPISTSHLLPPTSCPILYLIIVIMSYSALKLESLFVLHCHLRLYTIICCTCIYFHCISKTSQKSALDTQYEYAFNNIIILHNHFYFIKLYLHRALCNYSNFMTIKHTIIISTTVGLSLGHNLLGNLFYRRKMPAVLTRREPLTLGLGREGLVEVLRREAPGVSSPMYLLAESINYVWILVEYFSFKALHFSKLYIPPFRLELFCLLYLNMNIVCWYCKRFHILHISVIDFNFKKSHYL